MAIASPLLETSIDGAKAAIINICGGNDLEFADAERVSVRIQEAVDPMAAIYWGIVYDDSLSDEMRVTVIATGFDESIPSSTIDQPIQNGAYQKNGGKEDDFFEGLLDTWLFK